MRQQMSAEKAGYGLMLEAVGELRECKEKAEDAQ